MDFKAISQFVSPMKVFDTLYAECMNVAKYAAEDIICVGLVNYMKKLVCSPDITLIVDQKPKIYGIIFHETRTAIFHYDDRLRVACADYKYDNGLANYLWRLRDMNELTEWKDDLWSRFPKVVQSEVIKRIVRNLTPTVHSEMHNTIVIRATNHTMYLDGDRVRALCPQHLYAGEIPLNMALSEHVVEGITKLFRSDDPVAVYKQSVETMPVDYITALIAIGVEFE